jgi:hypothetical protein
MSLLTTDDAAAQSAVPTLDELKKMQARFAPVKLEVDTSKLSPGDRAALVKLVEAAVELDHLFLTQFWSGNQALYAKLKEDKSPLGQARLSYFWLNKGPWSALDEHRAFLPGVPAHKPATANFYPPDMTKPEFEAWVKTLSPQQKQLAEGFFSVIHRKDGKLVAVPYSEEYKTQLRSVGKLLSEAAGLTTNDTLRRFLNLRAEAFSTNDYYSSDVAWMDLDSPIDITIGPYETYNDELFGYKAGFEAYVTLRDEAETNKLKFFSGVMQEIEDNLPLDKRYKNQKIGALAPIRVVNQVIATGDAAHGVRTAAFNLPNDERVTLEKGTKRVMLKNVQEAKFNAILVPISKRVLSDADQKNVSFDSFFTHILAHEMTHGIGPQKIKVGERESTVRGELKELHSAVEEAKADVCGLFMLQYLADQKKVNVDEAKLYTTFLASSFRTMRFGLNEAHGKGMAVQVNYFLDRGAITVGKDGRFQVHLAKMKDAVRDLARDLLTMEATGDYAGAKDMLAKLGKSRPELDAALAKLRDIPVDIDPINVTAEQLVGRKLGH